MAEEGKKISFGFTKLYKLPSKSIFKRVPDSNVQFIDCLDSKAIKVKGVNSKTTSKAPLVIPLSTTGSMLSKSGKLRDILNSDPSKKDGLTGLNKAGSVIPDSSNDLESIAVRELLADVNKSKLAKESQSNFTLELPQKGNKRKIDKESTLEDYESVPVADYGLAMLRGMGWEAKKGIGKTEKVVPTLEPKVRPRGMGLGVILERPPETAASSAPVKPTQPEDELKIVKGGYVQITSGLKKDSYGEVEGFNEETGRLIIKLALGNASLSINEYMVKPVAKDEFSKNSRVLNATKYKLYKDKETSRHENGSRHSEERRRKHKKRKDKRYRSRSGSPNPRHK